MRQHVPPQQLWNEFHGDLEFDYDHAIYWPALLKLCAEKQAEHLERWVKGGKQYGENEAYIKGGDAPSIGESQAKGHHEAAAVLKSEDNKETGESANAVPAKNPEEESISGSEKLSKSVTFQTE